VRSRQSPHRRSSPSVGSEPPDARCVSPLQANVGEPLPRVRQPQPDASYSRVAPLAVARPPWHSPLRRLRCRTRSVIRISRMLAHRQSDQPRIASARQSSHCEGARLLQRRHDNIDLDQCWSVRRSLGRSGPIGVTRAGHCRLSGSVIRNGRLTLPDARPMLCEFRSIVITKSVDREHDRFRIRST
jgi:hypothetical protein